MKKLITATLILFFGHFLWAQNTDTTEIKIGKSKITIYDENARELETLKNSQQNFRHRIDALRDSIQGIREEMNTRQDSTLKLQLKSNIDELKKQINAYAEGIDDLNSELDKLKKERYSFELNSNDEDDNDKADQGDDEEHYFDLDAKHGYHRKFKGHWVGFEMGMNNFVNSSQKMELPSDGKFMELNTNKSWKFALNAIPFNIPLFSRYIGLVTGLGVEWNTYELKQNIKLEEDANGVIYGQPMDTLYKKNKLNVTYLRVPLLLEFQIPVTRKDHRLFIAAGVEGKLKLKAKYKQEYDVGGKGQKDKVIDDFQLSPYNYGLTARIGFRGLRLFADYSLTPLFEKNQGPELYPISVGLTLIGL